MAYYLFDNPRVGIALGIFLTVVFFIAHLARGRQGSAWWLLLGPAVAGLTLLADQLVETQREQVEQCVRRVVEAVEAEDAEVVIAQLGDDFQHGRNVDKQAAAETVRFFLSKPLVESNRVQQLLVRPEQAPWTVELKVMTRLDPKHPAAAMVTFLPSEWRFILREQPDGTIKITDIVLEKLGERTGVDPWTRTGIPSRF